MKDIQHYKDEVAKENGFVDWIHLLEGYKLNSLKPKEFDKLENEAMKRCVEDMCKEQKKLCADALDIGYEDDLHKQQILNARLATDK